MSSNAKLALVGDANVALNTITTYDAATTTPGLNPVPTSALDNITTFDVSSNIVLNYSENVTAVAGKYIHLINDGGTGFHGESATHTLDIEATSAQVSISNGKVTLNPTFDLDLANTYHIEIDAGAFVGASSGLTSAAFNGTSSLNFSTVTPGIAALANAVASQKMDASGAIVASYQWLDIEGIGSPGSATALDLAGGNYALVAKDYDPTGGSVGIGYDGIQLGDLNVAANNLSLGDLIYLDDQGNNLEAWNDLGLTAVIDDGTAPTTIQFAGTALGGLIDVSVAGLGIDYNSIANLNTAVGGTAVISA
jgi:hypothetical protein